MDLGAKVGSSGPGNCCLLNITKKDPHLQNSGHIYFGLVERLLAELLDGSKALFVIIVKP